MQLPSFFIPHGGGPCFFMDDPRGVWTGMESFLRGIPATLSGPPKAVLVVSGHWETDGFAFTGAEQPPLIYDYYNFPPHTYQLRYDAPGAPALATRAADLLAEAGIKASIDPARGLDHGVFVPLKVALPEAAIPVVEMSVDRNLDPALHIAAGRALATLRDEGVLILGSGMSFHNMRGYGDPRFTAPSEAFDTWLTQALAEPDPLRSRALIDWEAAPAARLSHPRAEHLLPLMVAAGAAAGPGRRVYSQKVLETVISGFGPIAGHFPHPVFLSGRHFHDVIRLPSKEVCMNVWSTRILSVLRVVAALLFMEHGLMKLLHFPIPQPGVPDPLPTLLVVAAGLEIVLGLLLTLGLFTRVAAFIASGQMAAAYFIAHFPASFWPGVNGGSEAILYSFLFLYLAATGAGAWSLDALRAGGGTVAGGQARG
jgi:aromatic ring-opening dioxygenase catalytic subunit (LigB family)/uncharacterized membrane protein YphA (DoxX/SURF4 family)